MSDSFYTRIRNKAPLPLKRALAPVRNLFVGKTRAEMTYWRRRHELEGGRFRNDHYRQLMLEIAAEPDGSFLRNKVIADFGCGPRGSLQWITGASMLIGIDVLTARYAEAFPNDLRSHGMVYVTCTERLIPMPSSCVDVLFTINALDHVNDLTDICNELVRVLKPQGQLIGSFNINEHATAAEPQNLNEDLLNATLFRFFGSVNYRIAREGSGDDRYEEIKGANPPYVKGERGVIWFRGFKK